MWRPSCAAHPVRGGLVRAAIPWSDEPDESHVAGRPAVMHGNGLRMAITLGVPAGLVMLAGDEMGGGTGLAVTGALAAGLTCFACLSGSRITLRALRARSVSEVEYPGLYRLAAEVSKAARLPVPRLYVSPAMQPNSLAIGLSRRKAAVCLTEGLLRTLSAHELRGVLGHELAHVRRRDTMVSSISAGLAAAVTLAASITWLLPSLATRRREDSDGGGLLGTLLMLVLGPVAALLIQLSVSRDREYQADAMGTRITGDPLALASALRKIETGAVRMPLLPVGPLASASHLMIVNPFRCDAFTLLFSTHPPTRERVLRLEGLAGYLR